MNDQMNDGVDSLPILGDIPVLGWLFKTQKTTSTKRTLMVFIKPTIVDSKALSTIEQEQQRFNKKDMLLTPEVNRFQMPSPIELLPALDVGE